MEIVTIEILLDKFWADLGVVNMDAEFSVKRSRGNQGATSNEQQLVVGVRQIHDEIITST